MVGAGAEIAKGAAMVVGGSLLLASNPVGWMVLGGAAIIGGIYAAWKWYKKKKRRTAVAVKALNIEQEREAWMARRKIMGDEGAENDPDPLGRELKKMGYGNPKWWQLWKDDDVTKFYWDYINDTAKYLETQKGDPNVVDLLKNMGLKVSADKTEPKWPKIAKALDN